MKKVAIIENGGANFASVMYALQRLNVRCELTQNADVIRAASHVILPGVGAAGAAMNLLKKSDLISVIKSLKQPVLGICLGMQILYDFSAEDHTDCLGIISGRVEKIIGDSDLSVPHMGWNNLRLLTKDPLLENIAANDHVYFVHSYAAPVSEATLAAVDYGSPLSAVVRQNNFCGTQFHPEKSGDIGEKILANFLKAT